MPYDVCEEVFRVFRNSVKWVWPFLFEFNSLSCRIRWNFYELFGRGIELMQFPKFWNPFEKKTFNATTKCKKICCDDSPCSPSSSWCVLCSASVRPTANVTNVLYLKYFLRLIWLFIIIIMVLSWLCRAKNDGFEILPASKIKRKEIGLSVLSAHSVCVSRHENRKVKFISYWFSKRRKVLHATGETLSPRTKLNRHTKSPR